MKPLKALLAFAVAMTATSSFAETANPLATFKQEAKTAINNELSSEKKAVTQTETSAATDMSKMKNAVVEKAKSEVKAVKNDAKTARETLNSVKTEGTEKVDAAKSAMKNAVAKAEKVAKININKADAATLQKLSGIGEAKAKAIVEYRNKVGKIKNAAELSKISGIGDSTIEKISPYLTF